MQKFCFNYSLCFKWWDECMLSKVSHIFTFIITVAFTSSPPFFWWHMTHTKTFLFYLSSLFTCHSYSWSTMNSLLTERFRGTKLGSNSALPSLLFHGKCSSNWNSLLNSDFHTSLKCVSPEIENKELHKCHNRNNFDTEDRSCHMAVMMWDCACSIIT